ncbi:HNH endonuclease signature motif containing protein [Mycolicibacterium sp. P9-64]|uniref:HNH endonuclease signature motif containing protein n=1 Tax=Mycolicibacterium sp. P9-64 TaxID=2024612 RepID=UPI0018D891F1|nr:HNH endonuclease signature motif containing protein [Mycolicibacterium sp. P9-64]
MSSPAASFAPGVTPAERLEVLLEEVAELTGQRNAIDGRVVQIVAEIDRDGLGGMTGARSIPTLVAWMTGVSPRNAQTIAAVAHRLPEFPKCAAGMREGRFSLDQVGAIAENAADGSDEHYAQMAGSATVTQLRTAIKLEPCPESESESEAEPDPEAEADREPVQPPEPPRSISKTSDEQSSTWRITLPHDEAAIFDAALDSHRDAMIAEWRRAHGDGVSDGDNDDDDDDDDDDDRDGEDAAAQKPRFPNTVDGFMSLVEAGWDSDVARRPHGQRTTVVVHVDLESRVAALHLGPLLTNDERRYLTCDATCEVWFERSGQVIGSGRETRQISRRLRRALEYRDRCCVVPGCGATRGLHAHHIVHWEDGGLTELANLVLVCPFHHRAHHRGVISITGAADHLVVTDSLGRPMSSGSLARPPTTPPPAVKPCTGPTGERADWWWYQPFQPQAPPPSTN